MRIISVSPGPVALVLSLIYAGLGCVVFFTYAFTEAPFLILPIGFVAPLIDFSFNLHLPRTNSLGFNLLYAGAALLTFALTGAITGGVGTFCFNLIAKQLGGIPVRFVKTTEDQKIEH
jgi:hypothetical protein